MFRVGQEYFTNAGFKVRIISNDANFKPTQTSPICNVVGIVHNNTGGQGLHYYSDNGAYAGLPSSAAYIPHSLVSDEPNADEAGLITDILSMSVDDKDVEQKLLKIIRQLRAK